MPHHTIEQWLMLQSINFITQKQNRCVYIYNLRLWLFITLNPPPQQYTFLLSTHIVFVNWIEKETMRSLFLFFPFKQSYKMQGYNKQQPPIIYHNEAMGKAEGRKSPH